MNRRLISSINIRSFIGTASVHISIPLSATSMLPRVGVGGLRASTATYFVLSVNFAFRGQRRRSTDTLRAEPAVALVVGKCAGHRGAPSEEPPVRQSAHLKPSSSRGQDIQARHVRTAKVPTNAVDNRAYCHSAVIQLS